MISLQPGLPAQIERITRRIYEFCNDFPDVYASYPVAKMQVETDQDANDGYYTPGMNYRVITWANRYIVLEWRIDVTGADWKLPIDAGELDPREVPEELIKINIIAGKAAEIHLQPVRNEITYYLNYERDLVAGKFNRVIYAQMKMDITPHVVEQRGENIVIHRT